MIRFRMLYYLYEKYYDGQIRDYQPKHEVFKAVTKALFANDPDFNIDENLMEGELEYLHQTNRIDSQEIGMGQDLNSFVKINYSGIDYVDRAINEFVEAKGEEQEELKELMKEQNPKTKIKKAWKIIESHQGLITTFVNFLSKYST